MAMQKLDWTNLSVGDLSETAQSALLAFISAKAALSDALLADAIAHGMASEGDTLKIGRTDANSVGIALTKGKAKASGWSGLRRPIVAANLADYQREQDQSGRRR